MIPDQRLAVEKDKGADPGIEFVPHKSSARMLSRGWAKDPYGNNSVRS